jgi:hypothetical protein
VIFRAQLAGATTTVVAAAFACTVRDTDAEALLTPFIGVAVATGPKAAIIPAGLAEAIQHTDADIALTLIRRRADPTLAPTAVRTTDLTRAV